MNEQSTHADKSNQEFFFNESESTGDLDKALMTARESFEPIKKDTQGYGYMYAQLSTVLDGVEAALRAAGLVVIQVHFGGIAGGFWLRTRLTHVSSNQFREMTVQLSTTGQKTFDQSVGSSITYQRRYAVQTILGISTEDDTDGNPPAEKAPQRSNVPRPSGQKAPDRNQGEYKVTQKQVSRLFAVGKASGWESEDIEAWVHGPMKLKSVNDLTKGRYDALIEYIGKNKPPVREDEEIAEKVDKDFAQ